MSSAPIDYGYPWWLSYGHVPILVVAVLLLAAGFRRKWRFGPMLLIGVVGLWAGAAFLVERFVIDIQGTPKLPTEQFLASGAGRVLDIGAGTGRSSIMVLQARPQVTLVASDLFAGSFDMHFGRGGNPQQRLLGNLQAAGVAQRATVETADMRKLPFSSAEFDGVISAYAMDHVSRPESDQSLSEAARVLKPGGEFLLMVVTQEPWSVFAFGPLLKHGGTRGQDWWTGHVQQAGFEVLEQGTRPLTLYILARRAS